MARLALLDRGAEPLARGFGCFELGKLGARPGGPGGDARVPEDDEREPGRPLGDRGRARFPPEGQVCAEASATRPPSLCPASHTHVAPVASRAAETHAAVSAT